MANMDFEVELFEKKLHTLKDSQESIQSLSAWCLERRPHHKKIVATWLQVLKKVKVEHRLTLFYLANDVIQYSKRKNFEFVESWGTALQRATTMVRDEKVKHRILRIFKIWEQRQVYDEEFLTDLSGLISAAPKKKIEPQPITVPEEFQSALLISTMRSCATLEQATDARLRDLRDSNVDIDNAEELCASLKDRRRVEDAEKEVESAVKNIESYVRSLEAEIRERTQVLELLEQADQFYETQRGEVKIVTNAYRNFGSRVKNLKKKLDELLPTLTSPIPSPDINAPSPSPDSDIELPGDDLNQSSVIEIAPPSMYGSYSQDYEPMPVPAPDVSQGNSSTDFTSNFSSFMGGNVDFDMRNIFNDRSPTGNPIYNEAMPIEVINMRPSKAGAGDDFSSSNFLKVPQADRAPTSTGIPGLGLDLPEPRTESPQRPDYTHLSQMSTPTTPRMIGAQHGSLNNHHMGHSTPLQQSHTASQYPSKNNQGSGPIPFDVPGSSINPLPPPPLPPPIFLEEEGCYNKLPPKFPTWTPANEGTKEPTKWDNRAKNSWTSDNGDNERWESPSEPAWANGMRGKPVLSETPESPPIYEKSSFRDPVQYDDPQTQEPILSSAADVDHRVIPVPMPSDTHLPHRLMKGADVDHRNLISLTGSPANTAANANDSSQSSSNNLWSNTDQDYRRQIQPGDIVESVDMEMSDEETDSKQKNRILVDVRTQDRDMRPGPIPHHLDMDMRVIPLPNPPPRGQQPPELRNIHPGPPPPPLPPFRHNQPDFPPTHLDFPPNHPNFRGNIPPPFLQEFPPDFHQNRELYDFQENPRMGGPPPGPDFHEERRYQEHLHHHHNRDQMFRGRGRPFPRGRRERFDGQQGRRHRSDPDPEANRGVPEMVMLEDAASLGVQEEGEKEGKEGERASSPGVPRGRVPRDGVPRDGVLRDGVPGGGFSRDGVPRDGVPGEGFSRDGVPREETREVEPPGKEGEDALDGPPGDCEEITSEERSQEGSLTRADEPPRNLSEHLEALMNSGKTAGANELKREANGGLEGEEGVISPVKKRALLPNGPLPELHPAIVYDYEAHGNANFRVRLPTPVSPVTGSPFAPWRGAGGHQQRPRGFRGGGGGAPRSPWIERPRGPTGFSPRGVKRGSFRGNNGGFRGRGRAGNW